MPHFCRNCGGTAIWMPLAGLGPFGILSCRNSVCRSVSLELNRPANGQSGDKSDTVGTVLRGYIVLHRFNQHRFPRHSGYPRSVRRSGKSGNFRAQLRIRRANRRSYDLRWIRRVGIHADAINQGRTFRFRSGELQNFFTVIVLLGSVDNHRSAVVDYLLLSYLSILRNLRSGINTQGRDDQENGDAEQLNATAVGTTNTTETGTSTPGAGTGPQDDQAASDRSTDHDSR